MILGIQYLRAIAALMVVFHHARHYFGSQGDELTSMGAAGVDIFFVISGFVMAHSTRNFDASGRLTAQAANFLLNRFVRIIPLYWLALLWQAKGEILKGAITSGLIGDFFFIPRYNPNEMNHIWPILVPGWTLNYEMFFYALFSIAMLTAKVRYVVMTAMFMTLATIGLFVHSNNAAIIFYTSAIPLEFMFGILLYQTRHYYTDLINAKTASLILIAGFGILAIDNGNVDRVIADGIAATFIVGAAIIAFDKKRLPLLQLLGDASYSIYITHLFAFKFAGQLSHLLKLNEPTAVNLVLVLGMHMIMATIVGVIIHKTIEKPVTSFLQARIKKRQASVLATA